MTDTSYIIVFSNLSISSYLVVADWPVGPYCKICVLALPWGPYRFCIQCWTLGWSHTSSTGLSKSGRWKRQDCRRNLGHILLGRHLTGCTCLVHSFVRKMLPTNANSDIKLLTFRHSFCRDQSVTTLMFPIIKTCSHFYPEQIWHLRR